MAGIRNSDELGDAVAALRGPLVYVAGLSAVLNVLTLGGSIYMMLVYDSVLPSRSVPTLIGLLVLVLVVYGFQMTFEGFRSRMLNDIAISFDQQMTARVQDAAFAARLNATSYPSAASSAIRDLDTIRVFLSGPGPGAFIDAPWILLFLLILGILHIWLAVAAFVGALIMAGLTYLTHRASAQPTKLSARAGVARQIASDERFRHAEVVQVLGMSGRLRNRWETTNRAFLMAQDQVARATSSYGGLSRTFRMALQSIILSVGALLVIEDKASGGVIFASSILSARALAPIDQIIAQWRSFEAARDSWKRLGSLLKMVPPTAEPLTLLPRPCASLSVEALSVAPPGSRSATVHSVNFTLEAGDVLGVIGASGSGKSTLVRALVGAWRPTRGAVRLDGATYDQYSHEQLGGCIGYLPQSVELLSGTVGENIARFDPDHNSDAIVAAATKAGVHDLIVSMPKGYETQVGADGEQLSGGQRQRIGLARALYGNPFLVVLDEPNANLDIAGEAALDSAIRAVHERSGIVVVVAHRGAVINRVNKLLLLADGTPRLFGPRDAVLAQMNSVAKQVEAGAAEASGARAA